LADPEQQSLASAWWLRTRGLIVVLWHAGLGISEALALTETDVDARRGSLLVRHRKGDDRVVDGHAVGAVRV
jgi:site-specific recombinase XerD